MELVSVLTLNREVELVSDAAVGSDIAEPTFLPNTGVEGAELRRLSTALSYEVSTNGRKMLLAFARS